MCPMCIGVATWYFAGASSAGGIAALVLRRSNGHNKDGHTGDLGDANAQRDLRGRSELPLTKFLDSRLRDWSCTQRGKALALDARAIEIRGRQPALER